MARGEQLNMRVEAEVSQQLDELAEETGLSRSEIARFFVVLGLATMDGDDVIDGISKERRARRKELLKRTKKITNA